jgi:hypothetical protein
MTGESVATMKELGVVEDLHMAAVADMVGGAVDLVVGEHVQQSMC